MYSNKRAAFLLAMAGLLASGYGCTDSDPVYSCDGLLKDKPLANIQTCVRANWQLHYKKGGITGNLKQAFTDTYLDIRQNDSVYFTYEGTLVAKSVITWKNITDVQGSKTFIMTFSDNSGYPYSWGVWGIENDTLTMYDNANDGFGYALTKLK